MSDLTAWLLERIAADEAAARAAILPPFGEPWTDDERERSSGTWVVKGYGKPEERCEVSGWNMTIYDEGGHYPEQAQHIARHDPARVLAECAAKRRIVALYRGATGANYSQRRGEHETAKAALLALASVYADHSEFREEWL